jgi:hypothetical protein
MVETWGQVGGLEEILVDSSLGWSQSLGMVLATLDLYSTNLWDPPAYLSATWAQSPDVVLGPGP